MSSHTEATSTRAEIARLTTVFAEAVTARDYGVIGPYYDEKARLLPPGRPMVEGRNAIAAVQREMIEEGVIALDLAPVDVIESGDLVIEIGRTKVTIRPVFAPFITFTKSGKSIVVWRKQPDGSLRIIADTFNSDSELFTKIARNRRRIGRVLLGLLVVLVIAIALRLAS
jgi:ketosteroid isomerase-like protein